MNFFEGNPNFTLENGIYCQEGFNARSFEKEYVDLRTKEGRMYDDATVKVLPSVPSDHPLSREWQIRGNSARKLVQQLKKENCRSLLEVGCGNGWLASYIQRELGIPVCGVDVEKVELEQAARVSAGRVTFAYADIFSETMKGITTDVVVLASCIQYFSDLRSVIKTLGNIGTIHIIDSPIYKKGQAATAKLRSSTYFHSKDADGMEEHYFHHEVDELREFDPVFLYKPGLMTRVFKHKSPFPWVRIAHGQT